MHILLQVKHNEYFLCSVIFSFIANDFMQEFELCNKQNNKYTIELQVGVTNIDIEGWIACDV